MSSLGRLTFRFRGIAFVSSAGLLLLLCYACADQRVITTPDPTHSTKPVTTDVGVVETTDARSNTTTTVSTTPVGVGGSITLLGNDQELKIEVVLVAIADPAPRADFGSPKSGNRWVSTQLRLTNVGSAVYDDSPQNGVALIDEQGQQFGPTIFDSGAGPSFGGRVTVAPGDTRLGWITFEIPDTAQIAKLQFTLDSGFGPETGEWQVRAG